MYKFRDRLLYIAGSILVLSFLINAGLPWLLSCEGSLWLSGVGAPSGGRLGVVLSFNSKEVGRVADTLASWPWPCTAGRKLQKDSILLLYGDVDLSESSEHGGRLRDQMVKLPSISQCFNEVVYLSVPAYAEGSVIYEKREEDGEIGRGRNTLFYTFMLEQVPRNGSEVHRLGLQHVLWMEPDVEARSEVRHY
jgi:hypothetical protein